MKCEGCNHYVNAQARFCICGKRTPAKFDVKNENKTWLHYTYTNVNNHGQLG